MTTLDTRQPAARLRSAAALVSYIAAIVAANWLTSRYELVPVGFGLSVTAGTFAAGVALLARDAVQENLGRTWARAGIALGALATLTFSPALAAASAVAFLAAETVDMAVYTRMRDGGRARAALSSGAAGGVVDTAVFLSLAPFPFQWSAFAGQLVGKVVWATALPVLVFVVYRAVRRGPVLRDALNA